MGYLFPSNRGKFAQIALNRQNGYYPDPIRADDMNDKPTKNERIDAAHKAGYPWPIGPNDPNLKVNEFGETYYDIPKKEEPEE